MSVFIGVVCFLIINLFILLDKLRCMIKVDPKNKNILITGCDTGFGLNTAKLLHSKGFTIFAGVLLENGDGAKELKENFKDRMFVFPIDVTSDTSSNKAFEYVKANIPEGSKGIWAVITNAGWSTFGEVEWVPMGVFERIININLLGSIRTIKTFLPLIRPANGRVITVSSMCGRFGAPSRSAYTASKWAVEGFSEVLRNEMKKFKVKVLVIEPGNFVAGTALYANNAVKQQGDHMWNQMTDEVKSSYGRDYFDNAISIMDYYSKFGNSDIEPVLQTMEDAVSHKFPKARYQVMAMKERIKCFIATHMPSIVYDNLYG